MSVNEICASRCVIPAAREDRPRREFGFVHFEDVESAKRVVESHDTFTMDDKELNVSRLLLLCLFFCISDMCQARACCWCVLHLAPRHFSHLCERVHLPWGSAAAVFVISTIDLMYHLLLQVKYGRPQAAPGQVEAGGRGGGAGRWDSKHLSLYPHPYFPSKHSLILYNNQKYRPC